MPQTVDEIISLYNEIKLYVDAGRPIETKFLFSQVGLLVAEIERLREIMSTLLTFIDDGTLIRDISRDEDHTFFPRALKLVQTIKAAHDASHHSERTARAQEEAGE